MTAPAAAEWLRSAINHALASGITRREIFTMVATAPPPPPRSWPDDPDRIIYDEVPAGLLTLTDAAARYGVRRNTLEVAVFRGIIPRAGRIKGHGQGGLRHLVSEAALRRYLGLDPEPAEASNATEAVPESQPRPAPDGLPLYDERPEGLITLAEAARKYGVPTNRLRNWMRTGRVTHMGYLRGGSPQGGYVLLVEAELEALAGAGKPTVLSDYPIGGNCDDHQ